MGLREILVRVISVLAMCAGLTHSTAIYLAWAQEIKRPPSGTPYTPVANIGQCADCRLYRWTDANGNECEYTTCIYGGYPACANQTKSEHLCAPGSTYTTQLCTGIGVQTCVSTCSADGKSLTRWQCAGGVNIGSLSRSFCDYEAGCPVSSDGYVQGKPVTRQMICSYLGGVSSVDTVGACGAGRCAAKLICARNGACHCPPGGCPQCAPPAAPAFDLTPACGPTANGYACTYGRARAEITRPCPSVVRNPFPRALVGKPVTLEIGDACDSVTASNEVQVPSRDPGSWGVCNAETVIGYRATLAWDCSNAANAEWTMDERDYNIGQIAENGKPILNVRTGRSIQHVYETSSHDMQVNGPGYPDLGQRQPAYQVRLRTNWTLKGLFAYQIRRTETRCTDINGNARQCGVDTDIAITTTVVVSPWISAPDVVIPNIVVDGGRVTQDPRYAGQCTVIPVPVIQSQAVLVP